MKHFLERELRQALNLWCFITATDAQDRLGRQFDIEYFLQLLLESTGGYKILFSMFTGLKTPPLSLASFASSRIWFFGANLQQWRN